MKKNYERVKIEQLYNKYKNLLFVEANNILNNHSLAEEVMQQTFVIIAEHINGIGDIESTKTKNFLCLICRNLSLNICKKNKNNKLVYFENIDSIENEKLYINEDLIVNDDTLLLIKLSIKKLPEDLKCIILLNKYYGYTMEEIAKMLNISVSKIYKKERLAKKMLLEMMSERNEKKDEKKSKL